MKVDKEKRSTEISPEEAMERLQKIFKERGSKPLEMARNEILKEKIESAEAKDALTYFMTEYWNDLARPTLLSLACEAVGGNPELTTPIAVPMTLISGAIDIHDDIIDESKIKDNRPTVYGKFGKDIALLAGDALLFKGLTLLNTSTQKGIAEEKMSKILEIVRNMFFELGDAEALELQLQKSQEVSPEEYIRVVRKKAADVEAHTRISAIIGGGSEEEIEALSEYGRLLGMLIILRDDWIDMIDFEESVHRIKKECLPLPLLHALRNPKTRNKLIKILAKKKIGRRDAKAVLSIIYNAKGFHQYENFTKELARNAFAKLSPIKFGRTSLELTIQAMIPQIERTAEFLVKTTKPSKAV
ncbi:MAG: polyprenyl synthetase family protein [Candidatus Bathyarchaeota archaeon]|nr:MAG: polyprenyl synthetase family protein [Candidatus Bathyarchaeota archaeon]